MYQSILFLPVMLSLALVGIIWEFMYSQNFGLINTVIGRNHDTNAIDWLGDPHLNLWAVLVEATWRQAGYVMVLYLAGLKAVDPTLREAALVDGANAWQTFWRVVFPVMRPINIVIMVVTVIESLRAFDLVYITNKGINGLELLSVLVTSNIVGETQRVGFGSALGVVLLVISLVPISIFLYQTFRREEAQVSAETLPRLRTDAPARRRARRQAQGMGPDRLPGLPDHRLGAVAAADRCSRCTSRSGRTPTPASTATSRCRTT